MATFEETAREIVERLVMPERRAKERAQKEAEILRVALRRSAHRVVREGDPRGGGPCWCSATCREGHEELCRELRGALRRAAS